MDRNILKTSIAVRVIKNLWKSYEYLTRWILKIYKDSQLYKKNSKFSQIITICFKYSFLGRITEIRDEQDKAAILNESMFVRRLLDICRTLKSKLMNYLGTSVVVDSAKEIKKDLYPLSIKLGSIIAVTAISINIFLAILLHKEMELLSLTIQVLLLSVGLGGLFCNAKWDEIKKTSLLLRFLDKYCKNRKLSLKYINIRV